MSAFSYQNGSLHAENVSLAALAKEHGTPLYVYSRSAFEQAYLAYTDALGEWPHLVCFAVKTNSNLGVLNALARLGAGFDIVSIGELERVIAAGGDPSKVVFSGVGKQAHEIQRALECNILCLNIESISEMHLINEVAQKLGKKASISIRVNPNIDAKTHPYIATGLHNSKFGIPFEEAEAAYLTAQSLAHLSVTGIDCHIGSQITELQPFIEATKQLKTLIESLKKHDITFEHIDLGGGLGIPYKAEDKPLPSPGDYAQALCQTLNMPDTQLIIEPGRAIVGNAGALITEVIAIKSSSSKQFAIVDAAMNDLIRPALYQGWHDIVQVRQSQLENIQTYDIVGPVCESADFLGHDRLLDIQAGALLAVCNTGAYVSCMASNYNTRPRAPEVLIHKDRHSLIKARETLDDLLAGERQCLHPQH